MLAALGAGFPTPIVVDLHHRPPSHLGEILERRTDLSVRTAQEGEAPVSGAVTLAPPGRQLRFAASVGTMGVEDLPPDALGHPSADVLLASAAAAFGPRMVAVIMSGKLDGGAAGAAAVKRDGGRVLVQDPETAEAVDMPTAALATGCVDFALSPAGLAHALTVYCAVHGGADLFRTRRAPGASV